MTTLRWIGKPVNEGGVTERQFNLDYETGSVPGILWTPTQQNYPAPLVLLGHGGSSHKRGARQLLLAQWFAKDFQIASVAIDGPFHGDRVSEQLEPSQYLNKIAAIGVDHVVDNMINAWCATLDALSELDMIDTDRTAYIGLSMGTRFGLPFVAATGDRLRGAVFGKNGLTAPVLLNTSERFKKDAPKITTPILFHVQWDDELFPREGQFELFDLLGSKDKRLIAFPGSHVSTTPTAIQMWCDFIVNCLTG